MSELSGKVVLVTGGAKRVGQAIVRHLHAQGMDVSIHCNHSLKQAGMLSDELNQLRHHSAVVVQGDLRDEDTPEFLINQTLDHFKRVDVVINNASTFYATSLLEPQIEALSEFTDIHVKAPLLMIRAARSELQRNQGSVINITDLYASRRLGGFAAYSASKAALLHMSRSLAEELAPEIRVNAIAPGAVLWPEESAESDSKQNIINETYLGRIGEPLQIAYAVGFLIRDAVYITGQCLAVDGGRPSG